MLSNDQHMKLMSFQQSKEMDKIVHMCDCLNLLPMKNNLKNIVGDTFLLHDQQTIILCIWFNNILLRHQQM